MWMEYTTYTLKTNRITKTINHSFQATLFTHRKVKQMVVCIIMLHNVSIPMI